MIEGLAQLSDAQRQQAMRRWQVLAPHLEDGVPLTRAALQAGVPLRSARRWLQRYRTAGLQGLVRAPRQATGRKTDAQLVRAIEAMALGKPRPSLASITRRAAELAAVQGLSPVSYTTVRDIVNGLGPAMLTLAHDGPVVFRDSFELVYRRRADRPNAMWQADHTQLDIRVINTDERTVRPWLTAVLDDHSRAVPGYTVSVGAPSALNTSLALRQAIWTKADPAWPMCGLPDVLYADHGSDFISDHLAQVAAGCKFQIVHSTVARPQGRGKVERLFGTINTELLAELPGHLIKGKPAAAPALTLAQLDAAIHTFITGTYHRRVHSELGISPLDAWIGDGWLPRVPDSLEDLDLLLATVAKPRTVARDGISFQGLRYMHPALAAYVKEPVVIRYDPRDITEIRVFYKGQFLCKAVSPEHATETFGLKDIQAARRAYRKRLRDQINERITTVTDYLPEVSGPARSTESPPSQPPARRLRAYYED